MFARATAAIRAASVQMLNAPSFLKANEDDLDLVRRAEAGDPVATAALGVRLSGVGRIVANVNHRLGARLGRDELAELTQDVTVLLLEKLGTFGGRSTLEGWAWGYVTLQMKNRIRQVVRDRNRHEAEAEEALADIASPSHASDEDRQLLVSCLAGLPDAMAEVIQMKHYDGLMFKEIAESLRITENTAKSRYYRALLRIRSLVAINASGAEGRDV